MTTYWAGISLEKGARPRMSCFVSWLSRHPQGFVSLSDEYVSCAQALGVASGTRGCGGFKSGVYVPK